MLYSHFKHYASKRSAIKHWDLEEHSDRILNMILTPKPVISWDWPTLCSLSFNRGSQAVTPLCVIAKSYVRIKLPITVLFISLIPQTWCVKSNPSGKQGYICFMSDVKSCSVSHNLAVVTHVWVTAALDFRMPIWNCSCCELTHSLW